MKEITISILIIFGILNIIGVILLLTEVFKKKWLLWQIYH